MKFLCESKKIVTTMQENNRSELERLDRDRHDDFLGMLKGFVINQVLIYTLDDILAFTDIVSYFFHLFRLSAIYSVSECL